MSDLSGKDAFIQLIEKLYLRLFLPQSATRPNDPVLKTLIVPDEKLLKTQTSNILNEFKAQIIQVTGHIKQSLIRTAEQFTNLSFKDTELDSRDLLALANYYKLDEFHYSLLEQLCAVYNKEFKIPKERATLLPRINLNTLRLEFHRRIPTNDVKDHISSEAYFSTPPYWRWFWAILPSLDEDDKKLLKNPLLEKILSELTIPVFPRIKLNSFRESVHLPLNNAMRMAILLNQISPPESKHDNAVRKVMAMNFVTFGHKDIKVIGTNQTHFSEHDPIHSLNSKITFVKNYINKEANDVAKLYDKHFQGDHVTGLGTESLDDIYNDVFGISNEDLNDSLNGPLGFFTAIKRAVDECDPDDEDNAHDKEDDVPLGSPNDYLTRQGGTYSDEAYDDDQVDPNAEISEEEPEDGNSDDNVASANAPQPQAPPQPQTSQSDDDDNDRQKVNPNFRKLFKTAPPKVSSDSDASTYFYRTAVLNTAEAIINDPGPAVDYKTKQLLKDFITLDLWNFDPSETQKFLEEQGLLKYFKG